MCRAAEVRCDAEAVPLDFELPILVEGPHHALRFDLCDARAEFGALYPLGSLEAYVETLRHILHHHLHSRTILEALLVDSVQLPTVQRPSRVLQKHFIFSLVVCDR